MTKPKTPRAVRHLGTYYYAGSLFSWENCGHKHATVRAAMPCRRKILQRDPRIFMVHLGVFPAKPLD